MSEYHNDPASPWITTVDELYAQIDELQGEIKRLQEERNDTLRKVAEAVIATIPDTQMRDTVAAKLQDAYGTWWLNPLALIEE